jgi:hypothetical protein
VRRADDDVQRERWINGEADTHGHIELVARRHDDKNVNVAVFVRRTVRVGPEQDDPVGMELLRNIARETADDAHRDIGPAIPAFGLGVLRASGSGRHAIILARSPGRSDTTNAVMPVLTANATGVSKSRVKAASGTNATNVKASAGQLYGMSLSNSTGADRWFKRDDKGSSPTVGNDTPAWSELVPQHGGRAACGEKGDKCGNTGPA